VTGATAPGFAPPKVKLPGTNEYVDLIPGMILPPGTIIDLSGGAGIQLTDSDANTMTFYGEEGVPSAIVVTGALLSDRLTAGAKAAQPPVENLKLTGGNFAACKKKGLRAGASKTPPPVRKVWGKGKGHYRTQGKYAAATISGT
jgi:hypothetical protein